MTGAPESGWDRSIRRGAYYRITYENVGQMPDVHATVLQTDLAAEVNLTALRRIAESVAAGAASSG